MGIVKRAADLAFTFRFLRMLVMKWENWDAYKLGIIDDSGKRVKTVAIDNDEKKSAWTPFIRMAANIKRLVGQNKFTSLASALYLIKESQGLTDKQFNKLIKEVDMDTALIENNTWFVLEDQQLAPGVYRLKEGKAIEPMFDEIVYHADRIRVCNDSFPVGDVHGVNIYEAVHLRTKAKLYITAGEIFR